MENKKIYVVRNKKDKTYYTGRTEDGYWGGINNANKWDEEISVARTDELIEIKPDGRKIKVKQQKDGR
jgi:hypothetical protein